MQPSDSLSKSTQKHTIQQASFVHMQSSKLSTDYKMIKKLGAGAFSEVFLVQNRITGIYECAKIVEVSGLSNFEDENIMNEIKTLAEMDHPNIMKIKGYYQTANHIYIISEYLSGGELFDRIIEAHNFNEAMAAKLIEQILSAVAYLHKHDVIHRDLKPENIVFESKEKDSLLKIIDFGTSKKITKDQKLKSRLGTAYYIAPEVLAQSYDAKCDIWSCGVILYVFLFGVPPFNGKTDEEIFEKIKKGVFRFPENSYKVSEEAKKLIARMLIKDPDQRPSGDELLKDQWFEKMREKSPDMESNLPVMNNLQNFKSKYEFQKAILLYFVNFFDIHEEKTRLYKVFKLMPVDVTMKVLNHNGRNTEAEILQLLLFLTFLILLSVNFSTHYFLNSIEKSITKKRHIVSRFSLFFKEIDRASNMDAVATKLKEQKLAVDIR